MKRNSKEDIEDEASIFDLLVRAGYISDEELAEREKARDEPPKIIARPLAQERILRELGQIHHDLSDQKRTTDDVMRF